MIPMKHSSIFRSRWFALLWAAGILWFAYDVAGGSSGPAANSDGNAQQAAAPVTDATGAEVSDEQLKQFEAAINSI